MNDKTIVFPPLKSTLSFLFSPSHLPIPYFLTEMKTNKKSPS